VALALVFAGAVGVRADDQSTANQPEQQVESLDQMQSGPNFPATD
jgi:hypothetical protein